MVVIAMDKLKISNSRQAKTLGWSDNGSLYIKPKFM